MDIELLRRFVLGECGAAEREAVERWAAGDPARRDVIDAVRSLAAEPDAWTQRFDARSAVSRAAKRLRLLHGRDRIVRVRSAPAVRGGGRRAGHRAIGWAIAAAALLALGVDMAWRPLARLWPSTEQTVAMRVLATPRGQRAQLTLADSTRVELAPGSQLTYPAAFGAQARGVTLDGEAYFDVRHDAAHPFEVRTRAGVIRDIGTSFVVRQYTGDARLEVVVAAGRVAVKTSHATGDGLVMGAGQMLRADSTGRLDVRTVDAQRYLAWTHGTLSFDDAPLGEVAAQLSRWYDADVALADAALATRRFTGTFHDEPLDSVARALARPMHVRVERRGHTILFSRLPHDR